MKTGKLTAITKKRPGMKTPTREPMSDMENARPILSEGSLGKE